MVRPDAQEQLANAIYGAEVIELNAGHMACARPSFAQPMLEACRDVSLRAG
jgi:hypothetical protein